MTYFNPITIMRRPPYSLRILVPDRSDLTLNPPDAFEDRRNGALALLIRPHSIQLTGTNARVFDNQTIIWKYGRALYQKRRNPKIT